MNTFDSEQAERLSPPLSGLRVLDLSTMIAAPTTAVMLADYGADVVKVENPAGGDHLRHFGPQKGDEGLYWKALSRGKRSVALDLRATHVQDLVREWIGTFDVVIENFRPGTLEQWNLAPSDLLARHPRLVVLRVTAYGQDGPYRDRPGFGTLAEAMSGIGAVSGWQDRPPLLPAYPLADIMAGQLGSAAVLAALRARDHSGSGDVIDLAIYEAVLKLLEVNVLEYDQLGTEQQRRGNVYGPAAPRGSYLCSDGEWLALSGSAQSVAIRILRAVGGDELAEDPRFLTNADRTAHVAELDEVISQWCSRRTRDEAIAELTEAGGAVGPLETVATMLDNPQVRARDSIAVAADPTLGPVRMTNVYPRFSRHHCEVPDPGPSVIGADTAELISSDLGREPEVIESMLAGEAAVSPASFQEHIDDA
ncbi:CaiB/BaiF CoA transferase family protein [Aeromicrobium sp. CTD01-1L150]|uniref:CaiB/BaiF CoA transferase family protein n=1 Tax=Aeromicrobium sp. CTD01-1L150 TaxID=3341830 RepID=UPI0035BF3358